MAHEPALHSQVRALAWQLSCGEISWADYRVRRRALIEALLAGEVGLAYKRPIIKDDPTAPKHHDIEQVYIDIEELEREPSRLPVYLSVGLLAVLVVVLGMVMWGNHQLSQEREAREAAPAIQYAPGEALLRDFHRVDAWTHESLDAFIAGWRALDADERAAARGTAQWRRLETALNGRINNQQVLAGVDESGAAQRLYEALLAFRDEISR